MASIQVLMFGVAQEIFDERTAEIEYVDSEVLTVASIRSLLEKYKPALKGISSYMIAVNNECVDDDYVISEKDEIALIPPVSGG